VPKSIVIVCFAFCLAGCRDAYQAVSDEQIANFKEMTAILSAAKDPSSIEAAEVQWMARVRQFREASRRARELPPPEDEATVQRLREQAPAMQAAVKALAKEMGRVRELPGGPEFLERISAPTDAQWRPFR